MGEERRLRAEFALSTVATVTRVIARCETLCRGVYSQEFLHIQAGDRVGICDHRVQ